MCTIFCALIRFLQVVKKTKRCSLDSNSPLCQRYCPTPVWITVHHIYLLCTSQSTTYTCYAHHSPPHIPAMHITVHHIYLLCTSQSTQLHSRQQFLNPDVLYSSLLYHITKFLPKLYDFNCGVIHTHYKYKYIRILALITLKMTV